MRLSDIEPLNEARGFAARTPGEQFINPKDPTDIATFNGLTVFPSKGVAYPTHEELMTDFNQWKEQTDGRVYNINEPSPRSRGVMIIDMETPRGPEHFAYFVNNVATLTGKVTSIKSGVIPGHGGYVLHKAAAMSERAGVKPGDVLKTEQVVSIKNVANLLEPAKQKSPELVEQMQGYL